jgi:enoyl-CoA hydratase/carnithine racemase
VNFKVIERGAVSDVVLTEPRQTMEDLVELRSTIQARPADAGPLVIRPSGPAFCVGLNRAKTGPQTVEELSETVLWPILNLYEAISEASFPVVAAVRGGAIGLGFAIAASCDLIIASESATFAVPELSSGVPPLLALSALMKVLPKQTAFHMVATASEVDARRLWTMGAVADVVPDGEFDDAVDALGASLAAAPPISYVKEYLAGEPNSERAAARLGPFLADA